MAFWIGLGLGALGGACIGAVVGAALLLMWIMAEVFFYGGRCK